MQSTTSSGSTLVAAFLSAFAARAPEPLSLQEAEAPTAHALLVGCTEYPRRQARSSLKGCGNDVELIRERLVTVLGFPDEHVRALVGWPDAAADRPTLANIERELEQLAGRVGAGDRVLIYLAGHGSQQPDGRDADEDDGFDEVFLPADVRGTVRRAGRMVIDKALTDDELFAAVQALLAKGAEVCLLSDSCHSGTLSRGDDEGTRGIPIEDFGFELEDRGGRGGFTPSKPGDAIAGSFVGLFAVQADELAREAPMDVGAEEPRVHGIFSYSVARAITRTNGELGFDELHRRVVASYREHGYFEITPFVQGERAMRLRPGPGSARRDAGPGLLALRGEGGVVVDGGTLHGLYPGTLLAILDDERATELGRVRVVEATLLEARCEPVGDARPELTGPHPVRVLERPPGGRALAVFVEGDRTTVSSSLQAKDPRGARVRLVERADEADWSLRAPERAGDAWTLRPLRGERDRRYRVTGDELAETLLRLHRVATLMRLPGRTTGGTLPEGLAITLSADGVSLADGARIRPGAKLELSARNGTADPHHVWVFWIDADQGVTRVFPDPDDDDATAFLTPSLESRERTATVTARTADLGLTGDGTQGAEYLLVLAVPEETASLDFLQSARLTPDSRGDAPEGDAAALDEAAFGPRDGGPPRRGLGADAHVALIQFEVGWGAARPRARFEGRAVAVAPPSAATNLPTDQLEPLRFEGSVVVNELPGVHVLADRSDAPTWLAFDFEAPDLRTDAELAEGLRTRELGLELVLWFDPHGARRVAFYDTDLEGGPGRATPRFDLVRVDLDGDGRADREHRFRDGAWVRDDEPAAPWLRLQELDLSLFDLTDPFPVWVRAFSALGATLRD